MVFAITFKGLLLFALGGIMTKAHYLIMILGLGLFLLDISFGIGWILGWIFVGLLRQYRGAILERVVDFENFSVTRYIAYLFLVMFWIAMPLLISFVMSDYINPIAVFAAFFVDRSLIFVLGIFESKEAK